MTMNAETIIQIITLILGSGGLLALFFVSEKKAKAQIENMEKTIEQWKEIVAQLRKDLNESQTRSKEFQDLYLAGFDLNTKLRKELDEKNTTIAVLRLLRCKKTKCIDREPPYGSEVEKEVQQ
ncbi:MAG: hypothetical protein UDS46_07750 [Bacteroidales bacterium]|nr:hypothetical protein [Bacteroidales bacterium]